MAKEILVDLRKEIQDLRSHNINFIAVSNSEWYSLFRDEIRNSIAIEGVFANRKDLLDVLEKNKRTDKQKAAAILGSKHLLRYQLPAEVIHLAAFPLFTILGSLTGFVWRGRRSVGAGELA